MQSAISIKDSGKVIKVVTDRPMAGSAGLRNNSNIELVQARRLNSHDAYGISQKLNDLDSEGKGIQIRATYFLEITHEGKSKQRAL